MLLAEVPIAVLAPVNGSPLSPPLVTLIIVAGAKFF